VSLPASRFCALGERLELCCLIFRGLYCDIMLKSSEVGILSRLTRCSTAVTCARAAAMASILRQPTKRHKQNEDQEQ
jgi:hypothetical protein